MKHYISKDALVAEIERRIDELYDLLPDASKVENGIITISEACNTGKYTELESFRKFIDTLKVKEVDLDEEITIAMPHRYCWSGDGSTMLYTEEQMKDFAKHFFELGINKAQKGE